MSDSTRQHWLDSMSWQAEFYRRSGSARRKDPEFEWGPFERSPSGRFPQTRRWIKHGLFKLGLRNEPPISITWLRRHAEQLWETRCHLEDEVSRLMFDSALIVRLTSHRRFYFPRIDFDDLVTILAEQPFVEAGFPHDYLGVPLGVFEARMAGAAPEASFKVITRGIQLRLINSYRQYLIRRDGFDISPRPGEVVYDCGACIGEVSLLFAAMIAPRGEVHLFDPMPLHARFCELQASLNPDLASLIHINTLAVGNSTHAGRGVAVAAEKIIPGAISTADFACTRLDDYASNRAGPVDFIKMDIEGAEMEALDGAAGIIANMKPRLAISGYHKPEDLWEIPSRLRQLNPGYRLSFGHHTPIGWESVFYAVDRQ